MTEDLAMAIAAQIAEEYKISVAIVDTDQEYYSDYSIKKTVQDGIYFVSRESPEVTGRTTEHVLNVRKMQHEHLREVGYGKRLEKADNKANKVSEKIAEIKQDYRNAHNGREPNLSQIASTLNELNIESPQGKHQWFAQTVKRVLNRTARNL